MAGTGKNHLRPDAEAVLRVEDLVVEFPVGGGKRVHAVSGISFDLIDGETLGILGESGCGKSSAGRAIMQLPPPNSGSIRLGDEELTGLSPRTIRHRRSAMQMIMQDPVSSLNPRRKVKDLVAEGARMWGKSPTRQEIEKALAAVGLDPVSVWDRRPHELSGGQCQRVCIARALMLQPQVLVCDEPVSSLDVSVQAQVLNLLEETKRAHGLSMVFIAHDLAVVKNISDRIMVMYLGKVCEVIPARSLADHALHPYTNMLRRSVPELDPSSHSSSSGNDLTAVELPSPLDPPSGCRFRTRCHLATAICAEREPQLRQASKDHYVACHHAGDLETVPTNSANSNH